MDSLEYHINNLFGDQKIENKDKYDESKSFIQELRLLDEVFIILINQFNLFSQDHAKWFTFHIIKSIMIYRNSDIIPNYFDFVYNFLFQETINSETYQILSEKSANELSKAQAIFIVQTFPDLITDFFNILNSFSQIIVLRLIYSLFELYCEPPYSSIVQKIKSKFSNFIDIFLNIIFTGISSLYPISLKCLSFYSQLFKNQWYNDDVYFNIFSQGFNVPSTINQYLEVLNNLLKYYHEEELFILEKFNIKEKIIQCLNEENNEILYLNCFKLINNSGIATLSNDLSTFFFDFCIEIFKNQDNDLSLLLIPFIDAYLSVSESDLYINVFDLILIKLTNYFSNNFIEINKYYSKLTLLSYNILSTYDQLEEYIYSIIEPSILENIYLCSAILNIIYISTKNGYKFSHLLNLFQFFSSIIPFQLPLLESNFPLIFGFLKFCLIIEWDLSLQEYLNSIIDSIFNFIFNEKIESEISKKLTRLLEDLYIKNKHLINISNEYIQILFNRNNLESFSLLSNILSNNYNVEIIQLIISKLLIISDFLSLSSFLSKFDFSDSIIMVDYIKNIILTNLSNDNINNLLKCISCLGLHGINLLFEIYEKIDDTNINIITTISIISYKLFLSVTKFVQQNQDVKFMELLRSPIAFSFIENFYKSFESILDSFWASCPIKSEENEYFLLISNCLLFFGNEINNIQNEEIREDLLKLVHDILNYYYFDPNIIFSVSLFSYKVIDYFPGLVNKYLTIPSLNCLYCPNFDLTDNQWYQSTKELIKFHSKLLQKYKIDFEQEFIQAVYIHEGQHETALDYFNSLRLYINPQTFKEGLKQCLEFFSDMSL